MAIHPLAGQPAPVSMLVDVPQLITAYYMQKPDVSVAAQKVSFGTSGIAAPRFTAPSTKRTYWPSRRPFANTVPPTA
jgi:hypothetical protein